MLPRELRKALFVDKRYINALFNLIYDVKETKALERVDELFPPLQKTTTTIKL